MLTRTLLLCSLFVFLYSCNPTEEVVAEVQSAEIGYVTIADEARLTAALERLPLANGRMDNIDYLDQALKVQRPVNNNQHVYSMLTRQESNFAENLVLVEVESGFWGFLVEYHFENTSSFTGTIGWKNLEGEEVLTTFMEDGKNISSSSASRLAGDECYGNLEVEWRDPYGNPCDPNDAGEDTWQAAGNSGSWGCFWTLTGDQVPCSSFSGGGGGGSSTPSIPNFPDDPDEGDGTFIPIDGGSGESGSSGGSGGSGGAVGDGGSSSDHEVIGIFIEDNPDDDCQYGADENGCLSEEDVLLNRLVELLEENPFLLLQMNCEQIVEWVGLIEHTPPQEVINKLKDLDDDYTSILSGDWDIQYIEDASGSVVNMDYFPVTIAQLPNDPTTGETFTPEGFFNYVRTNLNDFFEGDDTTFGPYNTKEASIWNSDEYLGAIMRFDIYIGPMTQDGSVICSSQNTQSWTFTTIESPLDWSHPVSGNRMFGLDQNSDGSYTFYTRGVDRVAEGVDDFMGNLPLTTSAFEGGDALWGKLQENLEVFINDPLNGGTAQIQTPQIERPDWDIVRAVLNGEKPPSDLGCN